MAKTACLTALEFTNGFHAADPDIVVICGDRFEQLAIAMAAAYLNRTIAHIEGGDVSGSIDESVRHAITKLAHIHFVTNEDARRRVLMMGEDPNYVFNTGSLDVEVASQVAASITSDVVNGYGVGHQIDLTRPFVIVIQHPVTTEHDNRPHLEETLAAVSELNLPAIWIWPNPDAGTGEMADSLRHFREKAGGTSQPMRFITDVPVGEFIALLKIAACVIGNSSAGIKECSYLGTPVVDIGVRQQGRLRAENVVHAGYNRRAILSAVERQMAHGRYAPSFIYYREAASQSMVDVLTGIALYTQKRFCENGAEAL
jgi:UDP-hydrolysing UDP-N-acetyl-D-glucosamine 2-epimerase